MQLNLAGRVALITGPAKGMGPAITLAFAREGARLALEPDTAAIEKLAGKCVPGGRRYHCARLRHHRPGTVRACRDGRPRSAYERIDILVNVAGGSGPVGKKGVETTPRSSTTSCAST